MTGLVGHSKCIHRIEVRMKGWETLTDNLRPGWTWGCVAAVDSSGRTIWIADAHREDGKCFVVRADQKLTAFAELESGFALALSCVD